MKEIAGVPADKVVTTLLTGSRILDGMKKDIIDLTTTLIGLIECRWKDTRPDTTHHHVDMGNHILWIIEGQIGFIAHKPTTPLRISLRKKDNLSDGRTLAAPDKILYSTDARDRMSVSDIRFVHLCLGRLAIDCVDRYQLEEVCKPLMEAAQ